MWSQTCGNMAYIVRKVTLKKNIYIFFYFLFGFSWGNFWPLRTLWRNLNMFLYILESLLEEEKNDRKTYFYISIEAFHLNKISFGYLMT